MCFFCWPGTVNHSFCAMILYHSILEKSVSVVLLTPSVSVSTVGTPLLGCPFSADAILTDTKGRMSLHITWQKILQFRVHRSQPGRKLLIAHAWMFFRPANVDRAKMGVLHYFAAHPFLFSQYRSVPHPEYTS